MSTVSKNLLLGMALGGIGAALFWHFYPGFWKESPDAAVTAAVERRETLRAQAQWTPPTSAPTPDAQPRPAPAPRSACAFEPLIPPAGAGDGNLRMEHPFPADARAKAKVFLRLADSAAASGRERDEEVALIAACRFNDEASTAPTVPLARVLGELGDRYVAAAGRAPAGSTGALLARARDVLALSADTYAKALGPNAARSREALQRLAALDEGVIVPADAPTQEEPARAIAAAAPRAEPAPRPIAAKEVRPAARERPVAARTQPVRPAPPAARAPAPPPPAPVDAVAAAPAAAPVPARVAADPELRQLASDLARLRAQAEAVSDDPEGLRRRAERAEAERASCADAACLRDWHARRRQQLLAEF